MRVSKLFYKGGDSKYFSTCEYIVSVATCLSLEPIQFINERAWCVPIKLHFGQLKC